MTPRDIAQRLSQDAEAVSRMLLPNGKREGAEWRAGSVEGEAGKSLGVHLTGAKAGVWADFSANTGGDLLDLWAAVKGISLAEAIRRAKTYLGITDPAFEGHRQKSYTRPAKPGCVAPRGEVLKYLEGRKITAEAVRAYKVAAGKEDTEIVFPYLRDDELVNVKYLKLARPDGKKQIRLEKDCEPCLFGWQAIPEVSRSVTICEGEIDALSLWQLGFPALSVFAGAGSHVWVENEYPRLERFDEIFICFDRDEPGQKGALELAERLGRERCRLVRLPYKDANECLMQGIDADAIKDVFDAAATADPVELKSAADYVDDVIRKFYPPEGTPLGFEPPLENLRGKLWFRRCELIVVNGVNGHGKSQFVGHLALAAQAQQERVCVASMEMKAGSWLWRLVKQAGATAEPSIPYIRVIHEWFGEKLWVFDLVGTAKADRLLEVFRYARKRYGITTFVIDSLAKCGIDEDDYNAQKRFVEGLCDFKNSMDCTVFLVTHSRKGESEHKPSDKFDVKGTGAITDLADTVLTVWRNKAKEEAVAAGSIVEPEMPDGLVICQKHRNGDWEGRAGVWFDRGSYQFLPGPGRRPRPYVQLPPALSADEYRKARG